MKKRLWVVYMLIGLLLITASASLTMYNIRTEAEAGNASVAIISAIMEQNEQRGGEEGGLEEARPAAREDGIDRAERIAHEEAVAETMRSEPATPWEVPVAPPLSEKKTIQLDGKTYMGVLEIPDLGLQLPVQQTWSYPKLRTSPCRFYGSTDKHNLVLVAHNYRTHFGNLKYLTAGEQVLFTDMDGQTFTYEVGFVETVRPSATADVVSGEWDLTLVTCTIGGRTRVVVRCAQV